MLHWYRIFLPIFVILVLAVFSPPIAAAQSAPDPAFYTYFDQFCGEINQSGDAVSSGCITRNGQRAELYETCGAQHVGGYECCTNNYQGQCPKPASLNAACGIKSANVCVIRDQQTVLFANCGTQSNTCCYDVTQCPNVAGCSELYVPENVVCGCTEAPANDRRSSGAICCGWDNTNDTGTHCLAAAPTVFRCGELGYSPDKPTHKCECAGQVGTLGCCGVMYKNQCLAAIPTQLICGQSTADPTAECTCGSGFNPIPGNSAVSCCGYIYGGKCSASPTELVPPKVPSPPQPDPLPPYIPVPPPGGGSGGDTPDPAAPVTKPTLDIFGGPTKTDFSLLNPLAMFNSRYTSDFSSPAGIINRILLFAFPLAGLILFVMLVWGGFEVLTGAANSKGVQAGKQRITAALLGFGLLFVSFWIIQIVEYIFNLAIL